MERVWESNRDCRDAPEAFHPIDPLTPDTDINPATNMYDRARIICSTCPVIRNCLTYAVDAKEDLGMWGGTTPEERRRLRMRGGGRNLVSLSEQVAAVQKRGEQIPDILKKGDEHVVMHADPTSDVFINAAARLAGRVLGIHERTSPRTVIAIAQFVVRDGVTPLYFGQQHGRNRAGNPSISASTITKWALRIDKSLEHVSSDPRSRVLGIVPVSELPILDASDPRYVEGICQALRLRAITQRIEVDTLGMLQMAQGQPTRSELHGWANKNSISPQLAKQYFNAAILRLKQLPPEVKAHIEENPPAVEQRAS
jgi:WhiB family transcriptional regulator, redox-sensing transcriptional regulator